MATDAKQASRRQTQPVDDRPKAPRARRRPSRWLVIALVGLLGVVWLLPSIVAHSPLLNWGVRLATTDLNGSVTIQSASLGWLSPIAAQGIDIKDAKGRPLFELPALAGDRSLLALLCNSSNLGHFRLERPKLSVLLRDDGSNVEDALAKYMAPKPDQPKSSTKLSVSLEVVDACVSVTDEFSRQSWQVQNLGLGFDMPEGTDGPLKTTLTADLFDVHQPSVAERGQSHFRLGENRDSPRPGKLKADLKMAPDGNKAGLEINGLPLAMFRPIVWRIAPGTRIGGRLSTAASVTWGGTAKYTVEVDVDTEAFSLSAPALQTDLLRLERLHAACLASWQADQLEIQKSTINCDIGSASVVSTVRLGKMSMDALLRERHELSGRVDLARLAQLLPATLRLNKQVLVNSGEAQVAFSSQTDQQGSKWRGQLNVANLAANCAGRPVTWQKPLALAFDVKQGPDKSFDGSIKCEADFLTARANGNADALAGSFTVNLKQLSDQLGQFVDLGGLQLAGEGWGNVNWRRSPQKQFEADADVRLQHFQLGLPNRPAWREDNLIASLAAKGQTTFGVDTRIDAAEAHMKCAADQIDVQLLEPVRDMRDGGIWPVRVQAQGQLQSWPGRLAAWLPAKNCTLTGSYNLEAAGTASRQAIDLRQVKFSSAPLIVASPWLNVNEPQLTLSAAGSWNQAARRLQLDPATLVCATLGVQANNVVVAVPENGPMELAGTLAYQGDVGRLRQWLSDPSQRPKWQLAGQLKGQAVVRQAAGVIRGETNTDLTNLAVVDASGQQFQEPVMRLAARGNYTNASGVIELEQFELASPIVAANVTGRVSPVSGKNNADIGGQVGYDFERLAALARPYLGSNVQVSGRGSSQAWYRGPFDLGTGTAAASFRWDWANLYGFRMGSGELKATMANGIAQIEPLDLAVSQGRMHLAPRLRLKPDPMELTLPKGPLVEQIQIDPTLCGSLLKFIAPVVAGVTTAKGSFSLDLDGCRIPLNEPGTGELAGRFTVHSAEIGPGPLIRELAVFMGREQPARLRQQSVVRFCMKEKRIWHEPLELMFPEFTVRTYGSVGLDETLRIMAEMPVPPKWIQDNPMLGQALRNETIRVPIAGTLSKPALDQKVMADLTARFLQRAATNVIQGEVNKQLDRLFGPRN